MLMELRQLRYFVAVAEELHFGRAAKRLHISQPALSFDIRKLEQRMGVQLFQRNNKSVRLTQCGAALLGKCRNLLHSAADIQQMLQRYAEGKQGLIRLGFINSMLYRGLPQALQQFSRHYPDVAIALQEMGTQEQIQALERRQIDLACVNDAHYPASIAGDVLAAEPLCCCLPRQHPCAAQPAITLPMLQEQPFILFAPEVSPYYHHQILAQCAAAGFYPHIQHQARTWLSIIRMVGMGLGVALVPQGLQHLATEQVCYLPLPAPMPSTRLMLLHQQDEAESCVQLLRAALLAALPTPAEAAVERFAVDRHSH
ncbi:LysR family transcriptional regulator [Aquitalea magnusonii]